MTIEQLEEFISVSYSGSDFPARVLLTNGAWLSGTLDIVHRAHGIVSLSKPSGHGHAESNPIFFGVDAIVAVQPQGKMPAKAPATAA